MFSYNNKMYFKFSIKVYKLKNKFKNICLIKFLIGSKVNFSKIFNSFYENNTDLLLLLES